MPPSESNFHFSLFTLNSSLFTLHFSLFTFHFSLLTINLYIHIPFCTSRCIYCDFFSTTGGKSQQDRYVEALLRELKKVQGSRCKVQCFNSLYIGGGTPSVLSHDNLRKLLGTFAPLAKSEVTIECNPDDVSESLAQLLVECGVNRVSMGVQTFSDERLRFLRRRHDSSQIAPAVEVLRKAGIRNISIDLMFGFPGETMAEWHEDLDKALALGVEHISAYSLMYEDGTPLTRMLEAGTVSALDDETCRSMYYTLIDRLAAAGYEQYEISNFCKPGFRSRHNSDYWKPWSEYYLGLGAGAHSYDGATRSWNVCDVEKYISGQEPKGCEVLDDDMRYNDLITTALRTREGIDLDVVRDWLGEDYRTYLLSSSRKEIENGRLAIEGSRIFFTRKGLYVSNDVMSELIMVQG